MSIKHESQFFIFIQCSCGNLLPLTFLIADVVNAQSGEVDSIIIIIIIIIIIWRIYGG